MATKKDLPDFVHQALIALGGRGSIIQVATHIWNNQETVLRRSGGLFYTWQYDMRWAANQLRRNGDMVGSKISPRGIWELNIK